MPTKLSTIVSRISKVPNPVSVKIVREFYQYMRESGSSEKHMTNELQVVLYFTGFLGMKTSLLDASRQNILEFLDSKQKDASQDPDKRWITTWNDYLSTIKHFFRWLYNQHGKKDPKPPSEWETPVFAQIKKKKTKRHRRRQACAPLKPPRTRVLKE
jgi:site-specific recombinase XerD